MCFQVAAEGVEPAVLCLDLENVSSLKDKAEQALSLFGCVDILINNAGTIINNADESIFGECIVYFCVAQYFKIDPIPHSTCTCISNFFIMSPTRPEHFKSCLFVKTTMVFIKRCIVFRAQCRLLCGKEMCGKERTSGAVVSASDSNAKGSGFEPHQG
jgi:hypothetical protein